MIKLTKGIKFSRINCKSNNRDECIVTCLFQFRNKRFEINNVVKWDAEPYLGGILGRNDALCLRDWLNECLNDKKCDECYNLKLPDNLEFSGQIKCTKCGEAYIATDYHQPQ